MNLDPALLELLACPSCHAPLRVVAGLFLAVPITGALAIVCRHVEGLNWVGIALAGPESLPKKQAPPT